MILDYNSQARISRTAAFLVYLQRFPCEFAGRAPTWHEEQAWRQRLGDWMAENSHEVDAQI